MRRLFTGDGEIPDMSSLEIAVDVLFQDRMCCGRKIVCEG